MPIENTNRPSASEQAVKDDLNRQKVGQKDPNFSNQTNRMMNRPKEGKSAFDQLFDKLQTSDDLRKQAKETGQFDSKVRDALQDEDKNKGKSERRESKTDDRKSKTNSTGEGSKDSKGVSVVDGSIKGRVEGKKDSGEKKSQDQSEQGRDDRKGSDQVELRLNKNQSLERNAAAMGAQNMRVAESRFAEKLSEVKEVQRIPPQMMDRIVRAVRIGMNKAGQKEMQVDLSDQMFKGLSMKVALLGPGKISITFLTSNADVNRLFEKEKGNISDQLSSALKEKNVSISNLNVQSTV